MFGVSLSNICFVICFCDRSLVKHGAKVHHPLGLEPAWRRLGAMCSDMRRKNIIPFVLTNQIYATITVTSCKNDGSHELNGMVQRLVCRFS